ncbi:DUF456 domain-containing protein [Nitrospirota bacterium]
MLEVSLIVLAVSLGVLGVVGSVMPALPGPPLGYIGLLLLHFARGGEVYSASFLIIFGLLTVAAVLMDYALPAAGAKIYGASKYGIIGSVVGMIIGLLVFAFIGMMAGMFLGAVIGEYMAGKKTGQAMRAGTASFLGGVAAMAIKLTLCVVLLFFILINLTA